MSTTINQYNVGLSLDAKEYIDNAKLSASETRKLIKEISQARTPAEEFSNAQDRIAKAYEAGAISAETANRLIDAAAEKYGLNAEAAEKLAQQERELQQQRQRSESITKSLMTAEEKYAKTISELEELKKKGHITEETFARGKVKANEALEQARKKIDASNNSLKQHVTLLEKLSQIGNVITGVYHAIKGAAELALIPLRQLNDLWNEFDKVAKKIDEVQKSATKLGLSFNELSGLRLAAQELAGSANALDNAMTQMMRRGFGGADPLQSFLGFADELAGMATQAERLQRATEVFGRGGAEVVAMLQGGSDAIREAVEFQQRWNSLTDAQTMAVEEYNDTLNRVNVIIQGITQTFVAELAPAITIVLRDIIKLAESFDGQSITIRDITDQLVMQVALWTEVAKGAMAVALLAQGQFTLAKAIFDDMQNPFEAAAQAGIRLMIERQRIESEAEERRKQREEQRNQSMLDSMETQFDAHERLWQEHMDNLERQFTQMAATALQEAEKFFEAERQRAMKMRQDVARGPQTMEVGSAAAVRFMAEQQNRALAVAAVPDRPTPGEQEIVAKAKELLQLQAQQNVKTEEQIGMLRELIDITKENGFKRIR